MPADPRKSELEREYLRYFPPPPPEPLGRRIVRGICAAVVILTIAFVVLELLLGALFKFL